MTEYPTGEAVGQTPRLLKSGEHDEAFYESLWQTVLAGDIWTNEIVNERQSGEQLTAIQTISPIQDDGEIQGFVAIQEEITDRRLQEQQLTVVRRILRHNGTTIMGRVEYLKESLDDASGEHLDAVGDSMASLLEISEKANRIQQLLADSLEDSDMQRQLSAIVTEMTDDVTRGIRTQRSVSRTTCRSHCASTRRFSPRCAN